MRAADALLIDFGGVLTTNVFDSLTVFCRTEGLPDEHLRRLFREGDEAKTLLVGVETGAVEPAVFEERFAALLSEGREPVTAERLIDRMFGHLEPEPTLIEAVVSLRRAGVSTVLLSNSLGFAAYDALDTERLFDEVVISGRVGMRKPDPRIYVMAVERAAVPSERCVFVDDLPFNLPPAAALGMTTIRHEGPAETVRELERIFAMSLAA